MDILKLIKFITIIILFSSCRDIKRKKISYKHEVINIENWDIKKQNIKKVVLYHYKKESDFIFLEKKDNIVKIIDDFKEYKSTALRFVDTISTNKDYKLIINDTILYKISNIKTSYKVKPHIPLSIDSIYNMIKSMNINGKEYKFDKAGIFFIPKDTYIIEK